MLDANREAVIGTGVIGMEDGLGEKIAPFTGMRTISSDDETGWYHLLACKNR
jgi:hypothetical protein